MRRTYLTSAGPDAPLPPEAPFQTPVITLITGRVIILLGHQAVLAPVVDSINDHRPVVNATVAGQYAGPVFDGRRGQLTVATPRRDEAGTVDGKLSEVEWNSAAVLTGFSQFFPSDGIAAQDSTEVLVWYSATALHVGVRAFAPVGSVRATLADRDRISQDDNVQLFLGTYSDSRQALVFAVNPLGVQSDGGLMKPAPPPVVDSSEARRDRARTPIWHPTTCGSRKAKSPITGSKWN